MKWSGLLKIGIRRNLALLSLITMSGVCAWSAPQGSDLISRQSIEKYLNEFGYDKGQTLADFWEKSRYYFPGKVYREIESFVEQNPSLLMPDLLLLYPKKGEEDRGVLLQITSSGKTHNLQFYGETLRWAKLNGVLLSQRDVERPEDAFARIEASNIKLKRDADQFRTNQKNVIAQSVAVKQQIFSVFQNDLNEFSAFPRLNSTLWKSWSLNERIGFLLKMRLVWQYAQTVVDNFDSTSDLACIASGYVGERADKKGKSPCNIKAELQPEAPTSATVVAAPASLDKTVPMVPAGLLSKEATDVCLRDRGSSYVACNPLVYGYPNGREACVMKDSDEFSIANAATAADGAKSCDAISRQSGPLDNNRPETHDYSKLKSREKLLTEIEKDLKAEEAYLQELFAKGLGAKKEKLAAAIFDAGDYSLEQDAELRRLQGAYENIIKAALRSCQMSAPGPAEKTKSVACDQLHIRFSLTQKGFEKFVEQSCRFPARANAVGGCECQGAVIDPGQKCDSEQAVSSLAVSELKQEPAEAGVTSATSAVCDKPIGIPGFDYGSCKCFDSRKLIKNSDQEFVCEGKSWLPWALEGSAMIIASAVLYRHSKAKMPPEVPGQCPNGKTGTPPNNCVCSNTCPSGTVLNPTSCACDIVPAPPLCGAPMLGAPPNCACPAAASFCASPQKIYNLSTCQCTDVPQPVACPNNQAAPGGNTALCPRCANGSFVPVGGCPTEGGSGHSCPDGGCNGGLPVNMMKK